MTGVGGVPSVQPHYASYQTCLSSSLLHGCLQIAAGLQKLGLCPAKQQDFRHVARLAGCVQALVGCLMPVTAVAAQGAESAVATARAPAAPSQPRPQDLALVEALLHADVLLEWLHATSRQRPKHDLAQSLDSCTCCSPTSQAWVQPVMLHKPAPGAAHGSNQVSVRAALTKLSRQLLRVVVDLHRWLESAEAAQRACRPRDSSLSLLLGDQLALQCCGLDCPGLCTASTSSTAAHVGQHREQLSGRLTIMDVMTRFALTSLTLLVKSNTSSAHVQVVGRYERIAVQWGLQVSPL